jgi:hypothetical protein
MIQYTYEEACRNYSLGFAGATYLVASSLLLLPAFSYLFPMYPIGWLAEPAAHLGIILYILGSLILVIAYEYPIEFYELLEPKEAEQYP